MEGHTVPSRRRAHKKNGVTVAKPLVNDPRTRALSLNRRSFVGAAALTGAALALFPSHAFGDEISEEGEGSDSENEEDELTEEEQAELKSIIESFSTLQAELETASDEYYRALSEQQKAEAAMQETQAQIDAATSRIDQLKTRISDRVRSMYKSGSVSVLDFLFGAATFSEFATNWALLQRINASDSELVIEAQTLSSELTTAQDEYARQEAIAHSQALAAESTRYNIESRVAEALERVGELDPESQTLLAEIQAETARRIAQNAIVVLSDSLLPVPDRGTVVDYAISRIGCPYVWGAAGPDSFDCSGLVTWCYEQVGVSLPHYTEDLYAAATNIVSVADARPGDVLYRPGHVGIAQTSGGLPYVHAPTFNTLVRNTDSLEWAGFICALQFA